jgi:dCTP deaminase
MSVLSDIEIKERSEKNEMIKPFTETLIRKTENEKVLSYGLSSYGYDVRVSNEFKVFTNINSSIIDPKNFSNDNFVTKVIPDGDCLILPPNSFALANTVETFKVPRDIIVICVGKSTYARCGVVVNVTPIEPEFVGQVVLEFSNTTNLPVKIYANEGACQFVFFKADVVCKTSYADRNGKYQGQKGITLPKV